MFGNVMAVFLSALIVSGSVAGLKAQQIPISVAQRGQIIEVEDNAVILDRAPFELTVELGEGEKVGVRTSRGSYLFDLAKNAQPLGSSFIPVATKTEPLYNPDEQLYVDEPALPGNYRGQPVFPQRSWWYDSETREHTCTEVTSTDGGYLCRRMISRFDLSGFGPEPFDLWGSKSLYLVFLSGTNAPDYMSTVESRRGFLRIDFRAPAERNFFDVDIYQNGERIGPVNHEVSLRRAPFEFRLRFRGTRSIYVHTSLNPRNFQQAVNGHSLDQTFVKGQTIALSPLNRSETLTTKEDDQSHQVWGITSPDLHSFTEIGFEEGRMVGRVVVSNLTVSGDTQPLGDSSVQTLYLVFYVGELGGDELQRAFLKIVFDSGAASQPTSAVAKVTPDHHR